MDDAIRAVADDLDRSRRAIASSLRRLCISASVDDRTLALISRSELHLAASRDRLRRIGDLSRFPCAG